MNRRGLNQRNQPSSFKIATGVFVAIIIVMWIVIAPFWLTAWHTTDAVKVCTVTDKYQVHKRKGSDPLVVNTSNCGTLQIANDLLIGRMDAREQWDRIKLGQKYEMKTIGWEYKLLSTKPNIISYKEVTS